MIKRIAVLGLGLIGGSIALALKKHRKDLHINGFDRHDVLDKALERKAIDTPCVNSYDAVRDADLVILALPIKKILFFLTEIAPHLKAGCIVTDVGSVKGPVLVHARNVLPDNVTFIGGHPMAGSEKSGIHHSDPFLFENATYALCPSAPMAASTPGLLVPGVESLAAIIEAIGANVILIDAEKHDRIAAAVSHLPQLLAVTLMNYVGNFQEHDETYLRLAAGGFRDMTRIASSRFDMWKDILEANEGPIVDALAGFSTQLDQLRQTFEEDRPGPLRSAFQKARSSRNLIPKDSKGFLHPLADVYVYAEDKPGFLYHLTKILHEASINIKDLELLKIREGIEGVFRIGFEDQPTAGRAIETLSESGYEAFSL